MYFMLYGPIFFKGGILGGTRQFWGNPYLNSTTVLFDNMIQADYYTKSGIFIKN